MTALLKQPETLFLMKYYKMDGSRQVIKVSTISSAKDCLSFIFEKFDIVNHKMHVELFALF